jgi:hypothetical protein
METIFYGKSQKAGLSKARASLITTFFFITNKESPLMKDDLGSVWGPTQRPQKKFEKKKRK